MDVLLQGYVTVLSDFSPILTNFPHVLKMRVRAGSEIKKKVGFPYFVHLLDTFNGPKSSDLRLR